MLSNVPYLSFHVLVVQIASWVAQASFEPLGLTVAVAKDRAIESLMQVSELRMFLHLNIVSATSLLYLLPCSSKALTSACALQVGDPFVLNCLGEAKYAVLMKVSRYLPLASGCVGLSLQRSFPAKWISLSPPGPECTMTMPNLFGLQVVSIRSPAAV